MSAKQTFLIIIIVHSLLIPTAQTGGKKTEEGERGGGARIITFMPIDAHLFATAFPIPEEAPESNNQKKKKKVHRVACVLLIMFSPKKYSSATPKWAIAGII